MAKRSIIILSAAAVSLLGIGRMPQLITIAAILAGCGYYINRRIDRDMRGIIMALFLISFLLQVMMSLALYNRTVDAKYYGFSYKGDDYVYGDFGTIVGDLWRRGKFHDAKKLRHYNLIGKNVALQKYQLYNAFIFYLFGTCGGQILLIMNCFFHAAIIIPVYFICKDLNIQNRIATFTLSLFLFWPSTFYLSLFNFKDPILLFASFLILSLFMRIRETAHPGRLACLFFTVFAVYSLREYLGGIFIAVLILYFLFTHKWSAGEAISLLIFSFIFMMKQLLSRPVLSNLYHRLSVLPLTFFNVRRWSEISETAYFAGLFAYTYPRMALYFPIGVLATLFLPFLLRPARLLHIAANIESILWWCLAPFLIHGIWLAWRTERKKMFVLLFVFFSWLGLLVVTTGNMGTLIRHKAVIYYAGFIFAGLAIDRVSRDNEIRA
jgi:hypothetical protein